MQLRRRRGAAAVALAVIAGALGTAPGALSAPLPPDGGAAPATSPADRRAGAAAPRVRPRPHSQEPTGPGSTVTVGDTVVLVTEGTPDRHAVDALRTLLRGAGARRITEIPADAPLPAGGHLVIRVGSGGEDGTVGRSGSGVGSGSGAGGGSGSGAGGADAALRALGERPRGDLPAGGYRLAVGRVAGRATVALDGVGPDGLFHAVQTLRQLTDPGARTIPGVRVRDWPATAVRGLTEGFYGTPWTHRQRLAQLDFMGRTKQNRYLYAPGDDLYRQARWREPYPAAQRARFRALAERAARNHVTLAWSFAPGQSLCLSSEEDARDLKRKVDAMWALGVRAFQLQFQDVSYSEWHCGRDADTFGSGPRAAARAQARVANAVARHLAARHPGAPALSLMPTEFFQNGATDYRAALSAALDPAVETAWSGVGVVPRTITGRELADARSAYGGHPLVTMDNYPVNDFAPDRIFLGPYRGREPAVAQGSAALLAQAMEQPAASRVPLFTAADFAWNPRGYRPEESWQAALDELAGGDSGARAALAALAGNDASSVLGAEESAYLRPLLREFWRTRTTTDRRRAADAAHALRDAFRVLRDTPGTLAASSVDGLGDLAAEVRPWTARLALYGRAGAAAVDMLQATVRGDGAAAWQAARTLRSLRAELRPGRVTVGKGVLDPFLERAESAYERWAGLAGEHAAAGTDAGTGRDVPGEDGAKGRRGHHGRDDGAVARWRGARPPAAVTALTDPGTRGALEAHEPGAGWRRLAPLAASGFTEVSRGRGLEDIEADAVRAVAADGRVRHVVPWFADGPAARFGLDRTAVDAEIGGGPERVTARLGSRRPSEVRGELTVEAPAGVRVRAPRPVTLPRGTEVSVPLKVTVPPGTRAGSYRITVGFAAEPGTEKRVTERQGTEKRGAEKRGAEKGTSQRITVRAHPRTGGPDLARGAKATSSGDETKDFPASAARDGDATTRWSSPADDGAWWQAQLAEPVRLGRVVLRWQDAYAARYRVETSADGRTWRTAAVVRDGGGGRESVRMDAPGTRFVRVRGEKRATRFGYSLWSVEAYAVAED
ncbi:beta-N-acetylglucosaminidase domain-containing protein [Streptomyces silvensis]|uniref:Hyaluronidase n=1 Tax=Streptomyces silvensis TaxID=1765722 RepID=A0A0W7WWB5_9ACTN|nr:beta-N-acetylglucosaminidase domain-containing protein [Streptomyces silvensis]KUF14788.1 hyaluronidase [Streptomyces silvensis]